MARKTTMMPMPGGGGTGQKILAGLVMLTILAMVIHDPAGSAQTVVGIAEWAGSVIDAFSTFGQALSDGP